MLPPTGYEIVPPPTGYEAIRTPARKLTETPTPMAGSADMSGLVRIHCDDLALQSCFLHSILFLSPLACLWCGRQYAMPTELDKTAYGVDLRPEDANMPAIKPEDMQAFGALLNKVDEAALTAARSAG